MECPECGGTEWDVDERRDERVCRRCGHVEDAHVLVAPRPPRDEPRAAPGPRSLGRLEKHQRRASGVSGSEHRYLKARDEARRIAEVLGCPRDVADRAGLLLKRARKAGLTQGRDLDALAAACLLASCRMLQLARTEPDVEAAARAPWSEVQAAYKALVQGLRLPVPPMTANEYIAQLASRAGLDGGLAGAAQRRLLPVCGTDRAGGKNPLGWAAAALYLAARDAGHKVSLNALAKAAGVSGSTVKARVEDLEEAS